MSINCMKIQRRMPGDYETKKWYPTLAPISTIGLSDVIQGIVGKCTLTSPDIKACLNALQEVIIEQLQMGNAVEFGDLGRFRPFMTTHFYNKAEGRYTGGGRDVPDTVYEADGVTVKTLGVTAQDIKGINIRFYPSSAIRKAIARNRLSFSFNGTKQAIATTPGA